MSRLLVFLFLVGSASPAISQRDSLWRTWSNGNLPDSTRLNAITALSWSMVFEKADSGMALARMQLKLAEKTGDATARYQAMTTLAVGSSLQSDYPAALAQLQQCLRIAQEMGDLHREANTNSNLSNVYRNLGDLPLALTHLQRSLHIDEELGNKIGLAGTYNNIGNVHTELGDLPKALANYERSAALYQELGNTKGSAQALMNRGATHLEMEELDKALDELGQSLTLYRQLDRKLEMGIAFNNLGRTYGELGRDGEAYAALDSAYLLFTELGSTRELVRNMYHRGMLLLHRGRAEEARKVCEAGLLTARKHGLDLQRKECSECLMHAYENLGDLARAFRAQQEYMAVRDSLDQLNNAKEVLRLDLLRQFQQQQIADSVAAARSRFEEELAHREALGREQHRRNLLLAGGVLLLVLSAGLWNRLRFVRRSRTAITREKQRSDDLLHNILPREVAAELKEKGHADARHLDSVTVLFTDLKGFTQLSELLPPAELVAELDACFKAFDTIAERHGIEKIKTIGDAYMAAGGVPHPRAGAAAATVRAALDMQAFVEELYLTRSAKGLPAFRMRAGCHTGPVVAGIVGDKKFQYDIWGDTVNTASRMESSGEEGRVNISAATRSLLGAEPDFEVVERGLVQAKGKGAVEMFFVQYRAEGAGNAN